MNKNCTANKLNSNNLVNNNIINYLISKHSDIETKKIIRKKKNNKVHNINTNINWYIDYISSAFDNDSITNYYENNNSIHFTSYAELANISSAYFIFHRNTNFSHNIIESYISNTINQQNETKCQFMNITPHSGDTENVMEKNNRSLIDVAKYNENKADKIRTNQVYNLSTNIADLGHNHNEITKDILSSNGKFNDTQKMIENNQESSLFKNMTADKWRLSFEQINTVLDNDINGNSRKKVLLHPLPYLGEYSTSINVVNNNTVKNSLQSKDCLKVNLQIHSNIKPNLPQRLPEVNSSTLDHAQLSYELDKLNNNVFKNKSFRSLQKESIMSIINNIDTFTIFPTGGGKSLIYQIAAVYIKKVCLVIMPLLSLIYDQLNKYKSFGLNAIVYEKQNIDEIMCYQDAVLIFVTPEKITHSASLQLLLNELKFKQKLGFIVVDEAHCVSNWGNAFRPDYTKIYKLKQMLQIPILALTASAKPSVQNDIIEKLGMIKPKLYVKSILRPNIIYKVFKYASDKEIIDELIIKLTNEFKNMIGIVYCLSRSDCTDLAKLLQKNGIKAGQYHAGLTSKARTSIQEKWMCEKIKVIVATIAFGMGVDKPNVRFVIHVSLPNSIESYYQESGRAGRDGQTSYSYLYYNLKQRIKHYWLILHSDRKLNKAVNTAKAQADLLAMLDYLTDLGSCRKVLLSKYFMDTHCNYSCIDSCDNCINKKQYLISEIDCEVYIEKIIALLDEFTKNIKTKIGLTFLDLVGTLKGLKNKKLEKFKNLDKFIAIFVNLDKDTITNLLLQMLIKNIIQEKIVKLPKNSVGAYVYPSSNANIKGILTKLQLFEFNSEFIVTNKGNINIYTNCNDDKLCYNLNKVEETAKAKLSGFDMPVDSSISVNNGIAKVTTQCYDNIIDLFDDKSIISTSHNISYNNNTIDIHNASKINMSKKEVSTNKTIGIEEVLTFEGNNIASSKCYNNFHSTDIDVKSQSLQTCIKCEQLFDDITDVNELQIIKDRRDTIDLVKSELNSYSTSYQKNSECSNLMNNNVTSYNINNIIELSESVKDRSTLATNCTLEKENTGNIMSDFDCIDELFSKDCGNGTNINKTKHIIVEKIGLFGNDYEINLNEIKIEQREYIVEALIRFRRILAKKYNITALQEIFELQELYKLLTYDKLNTKNLTIRIGDAEFKEKLLALISELCIYPC